MEDPQGCDIVTRPNSISRCRSPAYTRKALTSVRTLYYHIELC